MSKDLQSVNWLSQNLGDEERRSSEDEQPQIVIINDVPVPEDFKLSPEEYKRRYEARLAEDDTQEDGEEPAKTAKATSSSSVSWLNGSLSIKPSDEEKPPLDLVTERPAATYDLDPEEYKRIKEELEDERERTSGYYHDPDNFYSIGLDSKQLLNDLCS